MFLFLAFLITLIIWALRLFHMGMGVAQKVAKRSANKDMNIAKRATEGETKLAKSVQAISKMGVSGGVRVARTSLRLVIFVLSIVRYLLVCFGGLFLVFEVIIFLLLMVVSSFAILFFW